MGEGVGSGGHYQGRGGGELGEWGRGAGGAFPPQGPLFPSSSGTWEPCLPHPPGSRALRGDRKGWGLRMGDLITREPQLESWCQGASCHLGREGGEMGGDLGVGHADVGGRGIWG